VVNPLAVADSDAPTTSAVFVCTVSATFTDPAWKVWLILAPPDKLTDGFTVTVMGLGGSDAKAMVLKLATMTPAISA